MIMSKQRLKLVDVLGLTDDESELLELLSSAESLTTRATKELKFRQAEKDLIRQKLKSVRLNATDVRVTDHALIRYLERVVGVDIAALREEMLKKIPADFRWTDDIEYVNLEINDLIYVVRDRLIITV